MIKYKTFSYGIEIQKIEIERETGQTVWYSNGRVIIQDRKHSDYHNYYDSFEDAKQSLITRALKYILQYEDCIKEKKLEFDKIIEMKEGTNE
jgi:hypothetical protein